MQHTVGCFLVCWHMKRSHSHVSSSSDITESCPILHIIQPIMTYPTLYNLFYISSGSSVGGMYCNLLILSSHISVCWVTVCVFCVGVVLLVSFISTRLVPFRTHAPNDLTGYRYVCCVFYDILSLLCPKNWPFIVLFPFLADQMRGKQGNLRLGLPILVSHLGRQVSYVSC
jgi:hypothetical protein